MERIKRAQVLLKIGGDIDRLSAMDQEDVLAVASAIDEIRAWQEEKRWGGRKS
jgi:hypothetical protein